MGHGRAWLLTELTLHTSIRSYIPKLFLEVPVDFGLGSLMQGVITRSYQ